MIKKNPFIVQFDDFQFDDSKGKIGVKMKFYLFRNDKAIVLENPGKGKFQSWFKSVTLKNIVVVNEIMSSVSFKARTSYDNDYSHRLPI